MSHPTDAGSDDTARGPVSGTQDNPAADASRPGRDAVGSGTGESPTPVGRPMVSGNFDPVSDALSDEPQPIDPRLIAGGEQLIGAANDVTTGADTVGATTGAYEASQRRFDGSEASPGAVPSDGSTRGSDRLREAVDK
jgi:hypothetical protein